MTFLKQQTINSVKWNVLGQMITRPVGILVSIILANLIAPDEFGLLGMVMVFILFAKRFGNFGFASSIIFKQNEDPRFLSSIFWFNVIASLSLVLVIIALSYPIALFYNEPRLKGVTIAVAFTIPIESLNLVQNALLRKNLQFKTLAFRESGGTIGAGIAGILAAMYGVGVWALIIQQYVGAILGVLLIWNQSKWRPSFYFSFHEIGKVWKFGSNLTGYQILGFFSRNMDNLLIGKFIGAAGLGIYSRGYTFVTMPVNQIAGVLGRVMYPAMSRINEDHEKLRKVYLLTNQTIALVAFPITICLFVIAEPFVLGFLGGQWEALIPIIKMFALVGMYQAINSTTGLIYQITGKTNKLFRWGIFSTTFTLLSFMAGIWWGTIEAVAFAYTFVNLGILLIPSFKYPFTIINLSFKKFVKGLAPFLIISIIAGIIAFFACTFLALMVGHLVNTIITTGIFGITYLSLLHLIRPASLVRIISELSGFHPVFKQYLAYISKTH